MKKILVLVVFFALFSCSNEDSKQDKLLKSIVEVSDDESSATTFFTYNGNKIESIDEDDKSTVFTYTDNLITQAIILDKTNQHQNLLQYFYDNNQLVQVVSSDNYMINYIHNTDGTVSYEKIQKDNEMMIYHGVLYFQHGNLMKDERTVYDSDPNVQITKSVIFEYDLRINPMYNVLGFDKLLDYSKNVSFNNSKRSFEISSVLFIEQDQVISSANSYYSSYKYDSNGYPTEVVSDKSFLGNENSNHAKTYFYYN